MHVVGLYNGPSVGGLSVCGLLCWWFVCWLSVSVMLVGGLPVGLSVGGMRMYVGFSAGGL